MTVEYNSKISHSMFSIDLLTIYKNLYKIIIKRAPGRSKDYSNSFIAVKF